METETRDSSLISIVPKVAWILPDETIYAHPKIYM